MGALLEIVREFVDVGDDDVAVTLVEGGTLDVTSVPETLEVVVIDDEDSAEDTGPSLEVALALMMSEEVKVESEVIRKLVLSDMRVELCEESEGKVKSQLTKTVVNKIEINVKRV